MKNKNKKKKKLKSYYFMNSFYYTGSDFDKEMERMAQENIQ